MMLLETQDIGSKTTLLLILPLAISIKLLLQSKFIKLIKGESPKPIKIQYSFWLFNPFRIKPLTMTE